MRENPGKCPREAAGKRVRVELRNGMRPAETWAADGKTGCRWTLTGDAFDIVRWEVI